MKTIHLFRPQPSDYLVENFDMELIRHVAKRHDISDMHAFLKMAATPPIAGGSGTMSNYAETHTLDGWNNKAAWPAQVNPNLALCTTLPDSSKTGATIVEATGYTGYVRVAIAAAGWNAATSGGAGAASTSSNNGAITGGNCTAGSAVVVGWALLDSITVGAGNMLWWGSATSTTINVTQTPPTIANGGLTQSQL